MTPSPSAVTVVLCAMVTVWAIGVAVMAVLAVSVTRARLWPSVRGGRILCPLQHRPEAGSALRTVLEQQSLRAVPLWLRLNPHPLNGLWWLFLRDLAAHRFQDAPRRLEFLARALFWVGWVQGALAVVLVAVMLVEP